MEKICLNCKHCSFNVKSREFEKINVFKKIARVFTGNIPLDYEMKHPKCYHPEIFKQDKIAYLVSGEDCRENLFCSAARRSTIHNDDYHTCGKDGKYFEEDK